MLIRPDRALRAMLQAGRFALDHAAETFVAAAATVVGAAMLLARVWGL